MISTSLLTQSAESPSYPSYDYDVARQHELRPHRRNIPVQGITGGFNQIRLSLIVSPEGDVVDARATGAPNVLKYWPGLEREIRRWKYVPFEKDGRTVIAEVEEYVNLVPPERLPGRHVSPPIIRPDSQVTITLRRSGCFGSCPSYSVSVNTTGEGVFDGRMFVVAPGRHTFAVDPDGVRKLAARFVSADFYSMDAAYRAAVTDNPTYVISIDIDGRAKEVQDYVGAWVGMPAVIHELEDDVDALASTQRWISGENGLVDVLRAGGFNFQSQDAQLMLKEAASRGRTETVQELLTAGVPLQTLAPYERAEDKRNLLDSVGFLSAASRHVQTLQVLLSAGVSRNDQADKDLALAGAARSGNLTSARALIAYGANPNADLGKLIVTEGDWMVSQGPGAGSILIEAARSGQPEMVREILRYHPKLELRDREGKTALFAAGDYSSNDEDGDRVECVRALANAGANVNARDNDGNTPLHEIFLTDVLEELLKLGADVNARNNDGETPIFTNVDEEALSLFIEHGASLAIRNNEGETVIEAAKSRGPAREKALRKAILQFNR